MLPSHSPLFRGPRLVVIVSVFLAVLGCVPCLLAESAYLRVSQVGYESGNAPYRAYLMVPSAITEATFQVINSKGTLADSGRIGNHNLLGTWGHSKTVTYNVY